MNSKILIDTTASLIVAMNCGLPFKTAFALSSSELMLARVFSEILTKAFGGPGTSLLIAHFIVYNIVKRHSVKKEFDLIAKPLKVAIAVAVVFDLAIRIRMAYQRRSANECDRENGASFLRVYK